jgi:adenosylcobinamide kinase/adenosylcobinamide-phosphate guanylyltransferase
MAEIILVTGAVRSGKSSYAQQAAEKASPSRLFIATALPLDTEMRDRIARHRAERHARNWQTVEAPVEIAPAIAAAPPDASIVVDCLTLWITNLMSHHAGLGRPLTRDILEQTIGDVITACATRARPVIFVTNEVGWGIVPENALAREFRDLSGWCSQFFAARARWVVLMVCGIPVAIKSA